MNLKDIFKYSLYKVIRNKKNVFLILILVLGFLSIAGATAYRNYLSNDIDNQINKDLGYRSISVSLNGDSSYKEDEEYSSEYNKLLDIDHVLEVYNFQYYYYGAPISEFENGFVNFLYGSKNTIPSNIIGETISENDTGVAICPTKFYPYMFDEENYDGNYINGKELIGTTLSVEEKIYTSDNGKVKDTGKTYKKKYKIVGLYDSSLTNDSYDSCFISAKDIKELYNTTYFESNGGRNYSSVLVIVDNLKNVDEVLNKVNDMGFTAEIQSYVNYDYVNKINLICNIVIIISCVSLLFLTILYIKKSNLNYVKEIGIQRALGFDSFTINIISMFQLLIIIVISSILGLALTEILYNFIRLKYENYFFIHLIPFEHKIINYYPSIFVVFLLPLIINSLFIRKRSKKSIILLLKGD